MVFPVFSAAIVGALAGMLTVGSWLGSLRTSGSMLKEAVDKLDAKTDKLGVDLSKKIEKEAVDLSKTIDKLEVDLSKKIEKEVVDLSKKVDKLEEKLDWKIDRITYCMLGLGGCVLYSTFKSR